MASSLVQENDGSSELTSGDVDALRGIVEGTAESTGEAFFQSLVEHLATAIQVQYAFVAEFSHAPTRVRTLAYWTKDRIAGNIEFNLAGTPCEEVIAGALCHHPTGVQEQFPQDEALIDMGIQSYLGVPLVDAEGQVLGHLAVFDERPMPLQPKNLLIFRLFASRAAAEFNRLHMEQMLKESEKR
ncbi:MAG: GAF domain-containing protein, partial [Thermoguttaceae bacterium]